MTKTRLALALLPSLLISSSPFAQKEKPIPACAQAAFAAFKPLPKLEYECAESLNDFDERILKLPQRLAAIRRLTKQLEAFTDEPWWGASVEELTACAIHKSAGQLNEAEKQQWKDGDYSFDLVGNHEMRLALLTDPCYQTGFQGSNAFLLYRKNGRVFVSQLLNGYFSRVANSVGIDFAILNGQQLIEVSTANSFPPSLDYHYFVIDPQDNKAVPKKLFKIGNQLSSDVYSAMLMADAKDLGLPESAAELRIIRNGRLAPSFSAYEEDEHGNIDGRLRRIIYRWNGRFYVPSPSRRR